MYGDRVSIQQILGNDRIYNELNLGDRNLVTKYIKRDVFYNRFIQFKIYRSFIVFFTVVLFFDQVRNER